MSAIGESMVTVAAARRDPGVPDLPARPDQPATTREPGPPRRHPYQQARTPPAGVPITKEISVKIQPKRPTAKGPADWFTGDVWIDAIVRGEEPSRVRVSAVRFTPSARTAWHSHAVGQTLYVTEGAGLVQSRGADIEKIRPVTSSTRPPTNGTGTAPPRTTSCPTFPSPKASLATSDRNQTGDST